MPQLMVLARKTVAHHAMRRLLGTESLSALDPESLFYLTWRWAYLTAVIPADEAYKLERAFDVDLGHLCRPGGFARQSGSNFSVLGPQERKGLKLSTSPALIDVLHLACQLWDAGRRKELEALLGATGMGAQPTFWSIARVVAEVLPEGDKERTMLLGLAGSRDALSQAAAKSTTTVEELTLFEPGQASLSGPDSRRFLGRANNERSQGAWGATSPASQTGHCVRWGSNSHPCLQERPNSVLEGAA